MGIGSVPMLGVGGPVQPRTPTLSERLASVVAENANVISRLDSALSRSGMGDNIASGSPDKPAPNPDNMAGHVRALEDQAARLRNLVEQIERIA